MWSWRTWVIYRTANILKVNRSSFMIDPDGSPNHDALPTPWVSLHHTCICVTFTSSSPELYSAIHHRNTEPTFSWEEDSSPLLIAPMLTSCGPLQSFLLVTVCKNRTSTMDIVGGQAAMDGVSTGHCCVPMVWQAISVVVNWSCRCCYLVWWFGDDHCAGYCWCCWWCYIDVADGTSTICICNNLCTLSCS